MNYQKIYNQLIEKRKNNILIYKSIGTERHHIIPKCLNGLNNNENLIVLTCREHYIAHLLLHRIHPSNMTLLYSVLQFQGGSKRAVKRRRFKYNSKYIDLLRKKFQFFLKNSIWINNGKDRRRILKTEKIPDGWRRGMGESSEKFKNAMQERTRKFHPIIFEGKTYTVKELSIKFNIPPPIIIARINNNWNIYDVLNTPVKQVLTNEELQLLNEIYLFFKENTYAAAIEKYQPLWKRGRLTPAYLHRAFKAHVKDFSNKSNFFRYDISYNGKTQSIIKWAEETGISKNTILKRFKDGWTAEQILTTPVQKSGLNFMDTPEERQQKIKFLEEAFSIFDKNGRGQAGLAAVNKKFNTNLQYDNLMRKFKRYGIFKPKS